MKYFIVAFKKDENQKPITDLIFGYYSQEELFSAMEYFHHTETLFAVYTANCVCDLS